MTPFSSIPEALEDIRQGKLIILIDNPDRENEGDFFMPAETATPEKVNFMLHNGRGLVCVALDIQQAPEHGKYQGKFYCLSQCQRTDQFRYLGI
jgi:3,4-dihydroxy-2-butanone 4-phosphate synthase